MNMKNIDGYCMSDGVAACSDGMIKNPFVVSQGTLWDFIRQNDTPYSDYSLGVVITVD